MDEGHNDFLATSPRETANPISARNDQISDLTADANLPLEKRLSQLFGAAVRQARHNSKMTQAELAGRTGLDRSHISDIERGASSPSIVVAYKLAKGLHVTLTELIAQVEQQAR